METTIASREGIGKAGRKIGLVGNFFFMKRFPETNLFHYNVEIRPEVTKKPFKRQIMTAATEDSQFADFYLAYDGDKGIYSSKELHEEVVTVEVKEGQLSNDQAAPDAPQRRRREEKTFVITMRLVARVNTYTIKSYLDGSQGELPQEALQAVDVAMRHSLADSMLVAGRSFFDLDNPKLKASLDCGSMLCIGFFQSIRPLQAGLFLQVDTNAMAFYEEIPLLDFIAKFLGMRYDDLVRRGIDRLEPWRRKKLEKELKGLQIEVTHRLPQRPRYRVNYLHRETAKSHTFTHQDSEGGRQYQTNVYEYFKERYNKRLEFPDLPLLQVGKKGDNFVPIEVCRISARQRRTRPLEDKAQAKLIQTASHVPKEKAALIEEFVRHSVLGDRKGSDFRTEFGLDVEDHMVDISGRVLLPPYLLYGGKDQITPRDGVWNMRSKKVYSDVSIKYWGIVNFDRRTNPGAVEDFARAFQDLGIKCNDATHFQSSEVSNVPDAIKTAYDTIGRTVQKDPQLIICILPEKHVDPYCEIKRTADTLLGVATQVVLSRHIRNPKPQYMSNVILKVNLKLGGQNQICRDKLAKISDIPTMVLGIDVCHPPPLVKSTPSVVALVGSIDVNAVQYISTLRTQPHHQEVIAELKPMLMEVLRGFYKAVDKTKPRRLIFFRDGVGEGQFKNILNFEIGAIKEACNTVEKGYSPKITFIIQQKRNHAKLFPGDRRDGDRTGNVPSGTIVDDRICHPREFDYYLVSHSGLKGTSHPTRYIVLYDENNFTADEIQGLTFNLCHLYGRCTRAVSVPAPTYYARLLCSRGKMYFPGYADETTTASSNKSADDVSGVALTAIKPNLANRMYFV